MNRIEVLNAINTNPRYAKDALANMYHGKTFVVANNRIDTFKKTKRGAEGYIKKQQSISYYDDMTFSMVTCGSGLEVFEIQQSEILDYKTSVKMWYDYIRSIWSKDWIVRYATEEARRFQVSDDVLAYVTRAVKEALTESCFTHIDEYENTPLEDIQAPEAEQTENTVTESHNTDSAITLEIVLNEELNGIELYFSDKPTETIRKELKSNGFRWHKMGYWYAKNTPDRLMLAESLQSIYNDIKAEIEENGSLLDVELETVTKTPVNESEVTDDNNQPITTPEGKIEVQSIQFIWSESAYIEDDTTVSTFTEAEAMIKNAAIHAPDNGCYDKTKFLITWSDCQTYEGRIDIVKSDSFKTQPLKNHIERFASFVIDDESESTERKEAYREFLNTYPLEDFTPTTPEKLNKSAKGNVLDFSTRFQQKQEKEEINRLTNHWLNNILPYMTNEEIDQLQQAYKVDDDQQIERIFTKISLSTAVKRASEELIQN
ncbi:LPD25 domain-containing protein [Robertmurraya siralis]|uniref:LPD25 domain-containing protein n=1 Tax=Robertmurraya siralis TaxID=77777 RepID=UPI0010F87A21|nr:LPD25 domain-containing protein [Robertmurraya siralis]